MSDDVTLPDAIRWLETWANAAETPHEKHDAECVRVVLAELARLRADARAVRAVHVWARENVGDRKIDIDLLTGYWSADAWDAHARDWRDVVAAPDLPALGRALLDGGHVTLPNDQPGLESSEAPHA